MFSERLEFAVDVAYRAGKGTLRYFQTGVAIETKDDATPVTQADREAEAFIRAEITKRFPGETIVGEEEGASGTALDRWVIDPIDGTKSFVAGVPLFGTLLSYEVNAVPVLGIAYFPALDEMVFAERGQGTYWNGRRTYVSTQTDLAGSILCCGGHASMVKHGWMAPFLGMAEKTLATRTWCDAYGHALVATGRVDAMIDPVLKLWDISALVPIIEEAGGSITSRSGGIPTEHAISSNRHLHAKILEAMKG